MITNFLVDISNRAVRTDICADGAAVAVQLIRFRNARIRFQLILCEEANNLDGGRTCLGNCLRDILGSGALHVLR